MEMDRSLYGLAVSQMSTPITSSTTAQAQTSSTTQPQFTRVKNLEILFQNWKTEVLMRIENHKHQ